MVRECYRSSCEKDATSRAKETVSLLTATIKPDLEDSNMRFCFRVVSPEKTYCLQAESQTARGFETILALHFDACLSQASRYQRQTSCTATTMCADISVEPFQITR